MRLEDCPMRTAIKIIGGKWKPVILFHLMSGKKRYRELQRLLPEVTQKMLTQHLRELERDGIIVRTVYPSVPPRVEYAFSKGGQTLQPALRALCKWGDRRRAMEKQSP
jgi:DNA-binding HxlR family transcriptional regulator